MTKVVPDTTPFIPPILVRRSSPELISSRELSHRLRADCYSILRNEPSSSDDQHKKVAEQSRRSKEMDQLVRPVSFVRRVLSLFMDASYEMLKQALSKALSERDEARQERDYWKEKAADFMRTLEEERRHLNLKQAKFYSRLPLPGEPTVTTTFERMEVASDSCHSATGASSEATIPEAIREQGISVLFECLQVISSDLFLVDMVASIVKITTRVLNCERVTLFLADTDHQVMILHPPCYAQLAAHRPEKSMLYVSSTMPMMRQELYALGVDESMNSVRVSFSQGLVGAAATDKVMVNISDAYADPRFNKDVDARTGFRTKAVLCCPMLDVAGNTVAVFEAPLAPHERLHCLLDLSTALQYGSRPCPARPTRAVQPNVPACQPAIRSQQAINPLHGGDFGIAETELCRYLQMPISAALVNARLHHSLRAAVEVNESLVRLCSKVCKALQQVCEGLRTRVQCGTGLFRGEGTRGNVPDALSPWICARHSL